MDWLDKILDEYEKKEKERKAEKDEAKKKLAADLEIKRQQATTALEKIHKSFSEVKNKLKSRKYPCDSNINVYANAQTGKQHYSEAILIVRKKPLAYGTDLSKNNAPYILFSESQGSDFLCLEINITVGSQPIKTQNVPIKQITTEFINEQIQALITDVFK